jgi:putative ABC transport system permease protein
MELFYEIFASLRQHKTRTILTGFGVAWGIFILIVLVGAGRGLQHGVMKNFKAFSQNSLMIYGGQVTKATPYGLQAGTRVEFDESLLSVLKLRYPQITHISPEAGMGGNIAVTYKNTTSIFDIRGVQDDYMLIKILETDTGRLLNPLDSRKKRRVALIGEQVKNTLFGSDNALGQYIDIGGVYFQVIGVLKKSSQLSGMDQNAIIIPYSTMRACYNKGEKFTSIAVMFKDNFNTQNIDENIREFLGRQLKFDKWDQQAVYIWNINTMVTSVNKLFSGINVFLWILGLCLLLTGMIGISNIMLIVVKERTTEIGIRKAVGATPGSIMKLILTEALVVTTVFGVVGMFLGFGGIRMFNWIVSSISQSEDNILAGANIDTAVVLFALILLIMSGMLAGIFPAKKAAAIMPVKTLNAEMIN